MTLDTENLMTVLREPLWQYYISVMLITAPAVRIFMRAGLKPYPALFLLVPWIGHVLCIVYLACQRWPSAPRKGAAP